jgi:transcriptional regulator with XRE-family HTH domain
MTKPKSKIDEYIGWRIRESRLSLHLSQELLAKALGVSFQQVQNYEKGTNGISAVRLFDVCRILNAPLESMFPPTGSKSLSHSMTRSELINGTSAYDSNSDLRSSDEGNGWANSQNEHSHGVRRQD